MRALRMYGALGLLWTAIAVFAQDSVRPEQPQERRIAFSGSIGNRQAVLVIDGTPKSLRVGESWLGVRLLSLESNGQALVDIDGQRRVLRLGATTVNLGGAPSPGSSSVVKLVASDGSGHFLGHGQINGRSVRFLVDTGATLVAIGQEEADRLGLDYHSAPRIGIATANGTTTGYRIVLTTVRLGDVDVHSVDAVVQPQPMPFILLGNSFLMRFQMQRENDVMTLERRH